MKKIICLLAAAFLSTASMAQAHSVWINSFESHAHQPPHTMVSLGWWHTLPMDDILTSPNGRIEIETFDLVDPSGNKTELLKPEFKLSEPEKTSKNFELYAADLGAQKVALSKDAEKGVYQFSASSRANFYTQYIDKSGKTRMQLKPKDELDDIDTVVMSVKYQAFAKAYMTHGEWSNPEPLGHGLEIVPLTDLSDLKANDLVEVRVLFHGEPLNTTAGSMDFITAHSSSFGQSDHFYLMSYLMEGKARFRVQCAGQWMISVNHKQDVTPDGPLKDLHGKVEQVYHGASLTFNVK